MKTKPKEATLRLKKKNKLQEKWSKWEKRKEITLEKEIEELRWKNKTDRVYGIGKLHK